MQQAITRSRWCSPLSAIILVFLALSAATEAVAGDPLVIVFDGSGSMWGRLGPGPQSKLVAGRDGVLQAIPQSLESPVGLVSFGRRRGDCSDVELIAPVESGDRQRLVAPLERLNPRGRGPITLALRTAAKALEGQPGQHHVLLIHDEPDNCSQDACAAAAELKAADPKLVVSTVTLGASAEEVRAMACLSQTTGGRAFAADTPAEAVAAIGAAARLASLGGPASIQPPSPAAALRPGPAAPDRSGPPRARLTARLAAGTPILARGLKWRVWPAGGDGATIAETSDPAPDVVLDPGRYRVEVQAGLATATRDFEIKGPGVTPVDIALDAGEVRTAVTLRRGGPASASAKLALRSDADGIGGPAIWIGGPEDLIVPPGNYRLVVSDGQVRVERRLSVTPGQAAVVDLSLEAGRVMLTSVARDGGPPLDDVVYRVLEADPEARSGLREVTSTAAAVADLLLPAGTYQIVARQGSVEARERLSVSAGEDTRLTFKFTTGRLAASTRFAGTSQPLTSGVRYRIQPLDAGGGEPIETFQAKPTLDLAGGRYRVEARVGPANAQVVREIEVRPGTETQLALELRAAEVQLRASEAMPATVETNWEVADMQNRIVWRSVQPKPVVVLAEGRYVARLSTRTKRAERPFEVKAGTPLTIVLGDE